MCDVGIVVVVGVIDVVVGSIVAVTIYMCCDVACYVVVVGVVAGISGLTECVGVGVVVMAWCVAVEVVGVRVMSVVVDVDDYVVDVNGGVGVCNVMVLVCQCYCR